MAKKTSSLGIFTEAIGLYFSNFSKFMKYMTFPVLGQIGGLLLVFLITYFYTQNMPPLIEKFPNLSNVPLLIGISFVITLPGLAIFGKAFWEYLVAYGAVNSMYENMQKSGKVYDFEAHTELIKRRALLFIGLWALFGVFQLIAICPLFWVVCGILTVYFVLVFQVFTFEPELSPVGCVKKSLYLIKGHFSQTFVLMAFAGLLTYLFIPQLFIKLFELAGINELLANALMPVITQLQLPEFVTHSDAAMFTIHTFIAQILIQYTLPMRSIMWSMWYQDLNKSLPAAGRKTSSKKRPSEVLMEESHKKYGKKKLDRNLLRRASEKDDEQ